MNKPVYLRLSILDLNKTVIYEFWYYYVKLKYGENIKRCYINTDSYIVQVKTVNIYKDIAENVETRFDSSNFELGRPLPNWTISDQTIATERKNKQVIRLTRLKKQKAQKRVL